MNQNKMLLAFAFVMVAFFYKGFKLPDLKDVKLEKPDVETVELVSELEDLPTGEDASKLAGVFYGLSKHIGNESIKNNLQVQYFLDKVGKNVMGTQLVGKYPKFSPSAAKLITKVIGEQTETVGLTEKERKGISDLLYGFAWKIYDPEYEELFDEYKDKSIKECKEYLGIDVVPDDVPVDESCICEGKGYIVHGDGHRTNCPCVESGEACDHNPKCGSVGQEPEKKVEAPAPVKKVEVKEHALPMPKETLKTSTINKSLAKTKSTSYGYNNIPHIPGYRSNVGVAGMTVRDHLVWGAGSMHAPVPASYVDSLTREQQLWLHDYLHNQSGNSGSVGTFNSYPVRRTIFGRRR